jgi:hypothetical protein
MPMLRSFLMVAVGTSVAAGLGAWAQGFRHDLLDGPGTPAALGAASETAVNLPCRTRNGGSGGHGVADVMVAQDVTGTDDHEGKTTLG